MRPIIESVFSEFGRKERPEKVPLYLGPDLLYVSLPQSMQELYEFG